MLCMEKPWKTDWNHEKIDEHNGTSMYAIEKLMKHHGKIEWTPWVSQWTAWNPENSIKTTKNRSTSWKNRWTLPMGHVSPKIQQLTGSCSKISKRRKSAPVPERFRRLIWRCWAWRRCKQRYKDLPVLGLAVVTWLVVWLPFLIFPYIGFLIIPIDFPIFQRGGQKPPTSHRSNGPCEPLRCSGAEVEEHGVRGLPLPPRHCIKWENPMGNPVKMFP